jgi:hypothetical protein
VDPSLRSEGHDHAVTLRGEHWRNFDVAMDGVKLAVQKQDLLPVSRTGFVLSNPSRSLRLVRRADLALRAVSAFARSNSPSPVAVSPVVPTKAFCRKRLRFASVRSEIRFC